MGEYPLARARSEVVLRRSKSLDRPTILVSSPFRNPVVRSRSSADLTGHIRQSDKYKPKWNTYFPYRNYGDWYAFDTWSDRYYWPSPISYNPYSAAHYNYYRSPSSGNWTRYKSLKHELDYPVFNRRIYGDHGELRSLYTPYRTYLLDSMSDSIGRALGMYRDGLINYNTLDRYWITPSFWDRRFKDWRELYTWDRDRQYLPSYWDRRSRDYFTRWPC